MGAKRHSVLDNHSCRNYHRIELPSSARLRIVTCSKHKKQASTLACDRSQIPFSGTELFQFRWTDADQRLETASTTHSAVMFTMRRTVADGVRMCTGRAQPSSTGPTAMPLPAAVFSRL